MAAYTPRDEQQQFASDAKTVVGLLQREFPWINISPKLHNFLCHAGEFLFRFGSTGLYVEQAVEAWRGHINQNAARFSAGTDARASVRAPRAAAHSGPATDAVLPLRSPIRRRNPGDNRPARLGDRGRKENKGCVRHCRATTAKGPKERRAWAKAMFAEALDRIENLEERESVDTAGLRVWGLVLRWRSTGTEPKHFQDVTRLSERHGSRISFVIVVRTRNPGLAKRLRASPNRPVWSRASVEASKQGRSSEASTRCDGGLRNVNRSIYGSSHPRHTVGVEKISATSTPTVQTAKRCYV